MVTEHDLIESLAEALRSGFTGFEMTRVALEAAQLELPSGEGLSKKERVRAALVGMNRLRVAEISRDIGRHTKNFNLEELGLQVLEESTPPITEITRRDVAKCFGHDLSGERHVVGLVGELFPAIGSVANGFVVGKSLAEEIDQHMVRNPGDWDVEYLFDRIGAYQCSRDRFARLLAAALHPLCVRGDYQQKLAGEVSAVLARDGYALVRVGEESSFPIYAVTPISRGVAGAAKNLVFASNGPKPEIGFADAINNDIKILSNEDSCLVYDRPIRRDGLLWNEVVVWWAAREATTSTKDAARTLGARLQSSLASDGERNFFNSYFKLYRERLGDRLPALVPQVYLHYDPAIVKTLRHRDGLKRQRMDFLLLLPNAHRVVIEVDGSQHFSQGGTPSLALYAEMVSADRELRLTGYEVYRFGANELVGPQAVSTIERFFSGLWARHSIAGAQ
jgi:hypothetical protein